MSYACILMIELRYHIIIHNLEDVFKICDLYLVLYLNSLILKIKVWSFTSLPNFILNFILIGKVRISDAKATSGIIG
jgi:hypothetical protein